MPKGEQEGKRKPRKYFGTAVNVKELCCGVCFFPQDQLFWWWFCVLCVCVFFTERKYDSIV